MNSLSTSATIIRFLRHVLPEEGYKCWVSIKDGKVHQGFVDTFEELASKLIAIDESGSNAYFACATYKTKSKRTQENVLGAKSFWLDVDAGERKPYATADIAINALDDFCRAAGLPLPSIIRSGYGIHAWFTSPDLISAEEWSKRAKKLKQLCKAHGFHADPSRTSDSASILRPPGTHNWKASTSREVAFDCFMEDVPQDFLLGVTISTPTGEAEEAYANVPISFTEGVKEGSRTHELTRRAGQCFGIGMDYESAHVKCWKWNLLNEPPLDKKKFDETMRGIHKRDINKPASAISSHLSMVREVIHEIGKENLLSTSAHVWRWRNRGVWQVIADREVKHYVQQILDNNGHKVTKSLVDSVVDLFKSEIFAEEHQWNRQQEAINFLNGELHWNGLEWELKSHCRENYRTTQIPYNYDPQAKCPRFIQFLTEVFVKDADGKEKETLIVELVGYTLVSHALYEVFALLVGPGANGKSVLLDVIRVMLGAENVTAVQPAHFSHKHQRAHMHLKLANLVTEIAEGAQIADAELKAITSGELMTAEDKFKDPFEFRPFCTCWFGTNHLPHTNDFSQALFRRARVITFNRVFQYGVDADPDLKNKLALEIPGIINFALQAFAEVIKRGGKFTEPQSCLQAKNDWRTEADQAAQFLEEEAELYKPAKIPSAELYSRYRKWADRVGISRKLNQKNFTNRIIRLGGKSYKGTGGIRMIAGIHLRAEGGDLGIDNVSDLA